MPIKKGARVHLQRVHLSRIHVTEFQERYPEKLEVYMDVLSAYPEDDLGVLLLKPHPDYQFELLDGHHRFLAYIMKGRSDALALIVDESELSNESRTNDSRDLEDLRAKLSAPTRVHAGRTGGSDPRASSVVRQTEAIKAVVAAWNSPGREQYYSDVQMELSIHWRPLFEALNNLSKEFPKE